MTKQELRAKSAEELKQELLNLRQEQFNLRMQSANAGSAKPHLIKQVRKNIAIAKTILHEKVNQNDS